MSLFLKEKETDIFLQSSVQPDFAEFCLCFIPLEVFNGFLDFPSENTLAWKLNRILK